MRIVWAISGSFCTHSVIKNEIKTFVKKGYDITVLLSENSTILDTRFGTAGTFINDLEQITHHKVITTLVQAETLGPKCEYDCMIIAPCTSTVLAKWAYGDYDHVVTLGAKAILRNELPIVIGVASNDILGHTGEALFKLIQMKNLYFVPFYQDDYIKKPNSCVSKWNLIEKTLLHALNNKQIQPLLYSKGTVYD